MNSELSLDSPVDEIMDKMSIDDVYRMAHNYEYGIRSVVCDHKALLLWYKGCPNPSRSRWHQSFTDEQKNVQDCLQRVVDWMKNHPVEVELFLIERSPRLAVSLATKGGSRTPMRFHPENESRFFERCTEKPRFNKACVRYCDHYSLFAPNMTSIMLEAGYGTDRNFTRYIKKMQGIKKNTAKLIEDFLKYKGVDESISVKELVEELRT
jgi:hypothetical protein